MNTILNTQRRRACEAAIEDFADPLADSVAGGLQSHPLAGTQEVTMKTTNRRTFLARGGALAGLGGSQLILSACGGGGDADTTLVPAPVPVPAALRGLGLKLLTKDERAKLQAQRGQTSAAPVVGAPPSRFDLTERGYFPPVGFQGSSFSCTAWATAYAAATYLLAKKTGTPPSQSSRQISASHLWGLIGRQKSVKGEDCTTGYQIADVLDLFAREVVGFESQYPSGNMTESCPSPGDAASGVLLSGWYPRIGASLVEMKQHLAHHESPLVIGIKLGSEERSLGRFRKHKGSATYDVVPAADEEPNAHAMCIVGYDDSRNAWKIMNSWGTEFGEGGYMWYDYDALDRAVLEPGTGPEIYCLHGIELAGQTTSATLQFESLTAVHQVNANAGRDILYFNFGLTDWMQVSHVLWQYSDGVNQPVSSSWARLDLYAKAGWVYFPNDIGRRWPAGTYALQMYGTDRSGQTRQIAASAALT